MYRPHSWMQYSHLRHLFGRLFWLQLNWRCYLKMMMVIEITPIITWMYQRTNAAWTFYQIRKLLGCVCAGNVGDVFDPDMHHGTCVTHVPWYMPRSITSSFLWSRWRGKRSRHSRLMRKSQFYVSGKRPMGIILTLAQMRDIVVKMLF